MRAMELEFSIYTLEKGEGKMEPELLEEQNLIAKSSL